MATLYSWGLNNHNQLGHESTEDQLYPKKVNTELKIKSVGTGIYTTTVCTESGELYTLGTVLKVPTGVKFKQVACGVEHTLALSEDGHVYAFGGNTYGQLGVGDVRQRDRPTKINAEGNKFASVHAGAHHSLALNDIGAMWTWGSGYAGQLGDGELKDFPAPRKVQGDLLWKDVKAGENVTFAITTRGKIYSWGSGGHFRLGHGDAQNQSKPKMIEFLAKLDAKFTDVAIGYDHAVARTDKGVLYTWGAGCNGELGHPTTNRYKLPKVLAVSEKVPFKAVAVGYQCTFALTNEGVLYAWGTRRNGRLGDGQTEGIQAEPIKLDTDIIFTQLFVAKDHSFALGSGPDRPPRPANELAAAATATAAAGVSTPAPVSETPASFEPTPSEPKPAEEPKANEPKVETNGTSESTPTESSEPSETTD